MCDEDRDEFSTCFSIKLTRNKREKEMATNSPMECGVCHENFDEDEHHPRILPCAHHLCTVCISQLMINNTRKCPFCRGNIVATSAKDIMINHGLLDLIKYMTRQSSPLSTSYQNEVTPQAKRISDFKQETTEKSKCLLETCKTMQRLIENLIEEMEENKSDIHQQSETIKNEVIVKFNKMILSNEKYVRALKDKQDSLLGPLEEIKMKKQQLETLIEKLDVVSTFKEAGSTVEDAEETNAACTEWADALKDFLYKDDLLETTEKNVKTTKDIISITLEMLHTLEDESEGFEQNPNSVVSTFREILKGEISISTLREMREPVKRLINQGRIFAVQNCQGRTRSSKITLSDGKLCLHCLKDRSPPRNAFVLEHCDLLKMVNPSSRLTFLELGVGETSLGKMLIRLTSDTAGGQNFTLLCTGEIGPSYANTRLLGVWEKGSSSESVRGGDYEYNSGIGGKPLVQGIDLETLQYKRPWLAGTVWGYSKHIFSQFSITTRDQSNNVCHASIGIVEEGMEVLLNVTNCYPDVRQVSVQDCGIILPYHHYDT